MIQSISEKRFDVMKKKSKTQNIKQVKVVFRIMF